MDVDIFEIKVGISYLNFNNYKSNRQKDKNIYGKCVKWISKEIMDKCREESCCLGCDRVDYHVKKCPFKSIRNPGKTSLSKIKISKIQIEKVKEEEEENSSINDSDNQRNV